jgi:hypothetical protein
MSLWFVQYSESRIESQGNGGKMAFQLTVNGASVSVDLPAVTPLLWVIREQLKLTGRKFGCGVGLCGACVVHIDGKGAFSCQTQLSNVAGRQVTTTQSGFTRVFRRAFSQTRVRAHLRKRFALGVIAFIAGFLLPDFSAEAQSPTPPDVVKLPAGINLGSSSFYDGFGSTDPGWTSLNYFRWNDFTSIKDSSGQNSPLFVDPRIDVISTLFHAVYVSPIQVPNGAIAFEALLPIVDFQSHFNAPGTVLQDNGLNIGDMTFGAAYQSKPIALWGQSVLSWRVDLDFTAPTGGFDSNKDINQSSGFWSVEPYLAVTLLPVPKWEISARFNYIYNFSTSRGSDPPQIPDFVFRNGQAGQAGWINFASSYEVVEGVRPGLNGFWLQQFTNDRTNGISLPGTLVEELYIGPGLDWEIDNKNTMNFNLYLPISAKNSNAGPQFNLQYIHQF